MIFEMQLRVPDMGKILNIEDISWNLFLQHVSVLNFNLPSHNPHK